MIQNIKKLDLEKTPENLDILKKYFFEKLKYFTKLVLIKKI